VRALDDSLLDRRDEVPRNRPAEDLVHELKALAAWHRLHAEAAVAELPVSAGLLLVPPLHVGFAQNRLPVCHPWRAQLDLDVVPLLQLGDRNLDVLLAAAAEQELLSLLIAGEMQRAVLLKHLVERDRNLVLVAAALGLEREMNRRLRRLRCPVEDGLGPVAQRVAGERVLELRHYP